MAIVVFVLVAVALLYFVLPRLAGLEDTWHRIADGDPLWLALAAGLEILAWGGYITLFRTVVVRDGDSRIGWRETFQICMGAVLATRLFAAAGAGGVVLTAWALRRSGMEPREVATRMVAFLSLLYVVYMGALLIDGVLLRTGVLPGPAPLAFTVIPAALAGTSIAVFLAMSLLPVDFEGRLARWAGGPRRRLARWAARLATAPASVASGVRAALGLVRNPTLGLLGAVAWWGFDIAVLWACMHAFGDPPSTAVLVMAYFVGMLANVLPLPGGIGGVEGGMIGCLIAFGVPGGLAVVGVLSYRAFAFWLPTIPGAVAYLQLRRTVNRWEEEPVRPGAPAPAGA